MTEPDRATLGQGVPIRRLLTGPLADGRPGARRKARFDLDRAAEALLEYARAGFDAFDMADHYGSAEIVAGMVHRAMREAGETPPSILTKWCPAPGRHDLRHGARRGRDLAPPPRACPRWT
jgi:aryl-alcohol dehydrogenase-like predicted oxidoreductase